MEQTNKQQRECECKHMDAHIILGELNPQKFNKLGLKQFQIQNSSGRAKSSGPNIVEGLQANPGQSHKVSSPESRHIESE